MAKRKTILKDIPLAEITLRRYEKPMNLNERELIRKLCLSIGILQPGDSRDVIVDILNVLIKAKKEQKQLTSNEICASVIENRKSMKLPMIGVAPSNIRRQIKRLKDLMLIEKRIDAYRITEFLSLSEIFEDRIEKIFLAGITSRIKDYLKKIDEMLNFRNV
ncbi:hypothetical protein HYY70_02510 [Candidatus Woesearchaeota archaeon]|nr:hypothetical protein [Candidatus Woesearchaeota archaeon]